MGFEEIYKNRWKMAIWLGDVDAESYASMEFSNNKFAVPKQGPEAIKDHLRSNLFCGRSSTL